MRSLFIRSCRLVRKTVLIVAIGLLGVSSAHASPRLTDFRYTTWIEGRTSAPCEARLSEVARRFEQLSGHPVVEKKCGTPVAPPHSGRTYHPLSLVYRAPAPFAVTTVQFGLDSSGDRTGNYAGAFESFEACSTAESGLSKQFEDELGVLLLNSSCFPGLSRFKSGYVLTLEGAGRGTGTSTRLEVGVIRLYSMVAPLSPVVMDDFTHRLREQGARIAHRTDQQAWYYAEGAGSIRSWMISGLENDGACEKQGDAFLRALAQISPAAKPSFYCLRRTSSSQGLPFGLALWNGRVQADLSMLPLESYTSLEDCLADRARLERGLPQGNDDFRISLGVACVRAMTSLDPRQVYEARSIQVSR